jgi:trigger factor
VGGKPFAGGSGKDVAVELGSERFLPGFSEQLEGARAGQERELTVRFPEDYGNPELAGQEAIFSVRVHTVQRRELPEIDDEFAKDLGEFESLDALRRRIRADLEAARGRQSEAALRASLLDAVLARTSFEVPAGLIERRLERRLARAHQELEGSIPHDTLHAQLDQWRESWRSRAERDVREALVLEAVADAQAIQASDEEVDARIREMAAAEGVDAKRLLRAYRENEVFEALRAQLRDEKALAFLASKASIDDVSDT